MTYSLVTHQQLDPTRTTSIRRRLEQRSNAKWRQLRGEARDRLQQYDHPMTEAQRAEFTRWFERRAYQLLLEAAPNQDAADIQPPEWMRAPIDESFEKGAEAGMSQLEQAGAALGAIAAADILRRREGTERRSEMRRRVVEETTGAISATRQEVQRTLRESEGQQEAIAGATERMRKTGQNRMRMIARTEVVRGNNKGRMAVYEYADISDVGVQAEMVNWVTAGDQRVCQECEDLAAGSPYKRAEAENMLPAHSNCRCALLPVARDESR